MTSRDYLKAALGLGLAAGVLTAVSSGPAIAQGALRPLQALIVNTSADPVPVDVVSETPLTVSASTRNLDEPARNFLNFEFRPSASTYVVPDGKILVVDWVSSLGNQAASIHILEFSGELTHGTDTTRWTSYFEANPFGSINKRVSLYVKGGQTISWRSIGAVNPQLFAQGHLVSAE